MPDPINITAPGAAHDGLAAALHALGGMNVINVKDPIYGAVGDGVADDKVAIQAAVNWNTLNANKMIIFFPYGTYRVTGPITYNDAGPISITFLGGGSGSKIIGDFADYILKRSDTNPTTLGAPTVQGLYIINTNAAGGGILMNGVVGGTIRDCWVQAFKGVNACLGAEVSLFNVGISNLPGWTSGSIGAMLGGNNSMYACDITGYDNGVRFYGPGLSMVGCRVEQCVYGVRPGQMEDGSTSGAKGILIAGGTFEANDYAIATNAAAFMHLTGLHIIGSANSPNGVQNPPTGTSLYGIQIGDNSCEFSRIDTTIVTGGCSQYGIYLGANLKGVTVEGCDVSNDGIGEFFVAQNSGAQIRNCGNVAPTTQTYANRPTIPLEGDLWTFTDLGALGWGDAITAGGSSNRFVGQYKNGGWKVVAKA